MAKVQAGASGSTKRADARRNRERILEAGYAIFAEVGVDAQMSDIAEAAGLGVATLYRNFPTKEALVNAMVHDRLARCAEVAREAARHEDPWQALVHCFQFIANLQLENRVLSQFIAGRIAGSDDLVTQRDAMYEAVGEIVARAHASGVLRQDANVSDVRMALVACARVSSSESVLAQRLVRRYVSIVLDGFRAPGREPLEGPPLTIDESEEAFRDGPGQNDGSTAAFKRGRRAWPRQP